LYDGAQISTPSELTKALLARPVPLMRSFTENLMAYALGRRVEDYDMPTVRAVVRDAQNKNYRFSAFVMGVVNSKAFRSRRVETVSADASQH
jgi:CO/xanthine dehydrogenase FAD-binding subunit